MRNREIILDDGSLSLHLTDEDDTSATDHFATGEGGVGNSRFIRDLSGRELLVWRVPSRSALVSFVSCCPWVVLVAICDLVVHDGVVPRVLSVVNVGIAYVMRSMAITTMVDRLMSVVASVLSCLGGANEEGKCEVNHLK